MKSQARRLALDLDAEVADVIPKRFRTAAELTDVSPERIALR
jgi:hypothetical protein